MAPLNKQLHGYILLESILAMIIVMVCFGAAMLIYNNIITGMRGRLELQARLILEREALNTRMADRLVDEWVKNDIIDIEKSIAPYTNCENVYILKLTARDHDQHILATHNELIYKP
jgi:type II secretory pathway pseudopilin PulG